MVEKGIVDKRVWLQQELINRIEVNYFTNTIKGAHMETAYDLLRKLKVQLLELRRNNEVSGEEITPLELLKIRKSLNEVPESKKLPSKEFITNCADIHSVYLYFYGYEREWNADMDVMHTIDPWLNELIEKNYIVSIEKIKISEKIEPFHQGVYENLELLDNEYYRANFAAVTALSSSILSSLFKQICVKRNISFTTSDTHVDLYNKVKEVLKLDVKRYKSEGRDDIVKFTGNISAILANLNEIRNFYSVAHGTTNALNEKMKNLSAHHYKLIVDSTKSIANFLVNSYMFQYEADEQISF